MENSGPYIERCPHDQENPYAQINRNLIRDESLHPSVTWMLIYLLSMKDGWKITPKQIINHVKGHLGCGRDKVYDWIKQACEAGYMKKEEWLDGNLKRYRYLLSEHPKFKKSFLYPGSQDPGLPDPDRTYYKKEHKKDKHIKENKRPNSGSSSPSAKALELTFHFLRQLKEMKPDMKKPDIKKWELVFDRMLRLDKRAPEKVEGVR